MNKMYALVWNQALACWNVAHEGARRRRKSGARKGMVVAAVSLLGVGAMSSAFALPTGGAVVSGTGDILTFENGQEMSINQHSDKLITNWNGFSVAPGQTVTFNQPGKSSIALNRVVGTNASDIQGRVNANGQVFLVNPNGVVFGQGAQVNVGGLVASTRNISDADFTAGNYKFSGTSPAEIINNGSITTTQGGNVALLGTNVRNDGVIQAQMGRVALGAGDKFTVNFDGNNLLNLQVDGAAVDALVKNGGLLKADGGQVLMTAKSAGTMLQTVVNNQGTIEANTLRGTAGKITLDGGDMGKVLVAGVMTASATGTLGNGGVIETKGANTEVQLATRVNTLASNGQTGSWKITSNSVKVNPTAASGSDTAYADTLSSNLATTHIELASNAGDVVVGGPVTWNSGNRLKLSSKGDIELNGGLTATGANARVEMNAEKRVRLNGNVTLSGANASLGMNHNSGYALGQDAKVSLSGTGAAFDSNGSQYGVIQNATQLQAVNNNLNGLYVLGTDIKGYGAFKSIGGNSAFAGVFDGLGNTVSGFTVTNTGPNVGLFAANSGSISNLKLANMVVNGTTSGAGFSYIGGLAGSNTGTLTNVSTTGLRVNGSSAKHNVIGGLVGLNAGGSIDRASVGSASSALSASYVSGNSYTSSIGGLVGENVSGLAGAGNITNSTANVSLSGYMQRNPVGGVGGLVGSNKGGYIADSSSSGSINSIYRDLNMGGLIGYNQTGTVERSSSSASVRGYGASNIGGLVGLNTNSLIQESSSSSAVNGSGSAAVGGLVGSNQSSSLVDVKATGTVSDSSGVNIGGLVGYNSYGRIETAEVLGNVTGGSKANVGGLIGNNHGGVVEHTVARGKVVGGSQSHVGGLIGYNDGDLRSVEASGEVIGGFSSFVGGLVGTNDRNLGSIVETATSKGRVYGDLFSTVGGLAGQNHGQIVNSLALGAVGGSHYATLGGLVGLNTGNVRQSVATGKINYSGWGQIYGGLVGVNEGIMSYNSVLGEAAQVPVAGRNNGIIQ
ncbi:two-partner secretion domain-containing protein [Pseudomonas chlororaphis]|uniref:two-partner secretion domain-containing protein n=1 Tax=Pseudomonas chlororaphis TaxID=587753 RepID=UPI0015DE5F1A|nr:GLUG motif-containing protein [Pseudomonas chlororaphis]QLL11384.1 filamentous hemagglutinin N-terminal domain-containing protein [Pseudomonas chlororaphis subsp. aurantiaca]